MANGRQSKSEEIDWLYPDLLSKDGLLHILRQRQIKDIGTSGTDLENMEKDDLVDLYNRYILPMPQRKYRNNRGGRDRIKKQILLNRKRKIPATVDDDGTYPPNKKGMPSGLVNHLNHPGAPGSRLKPPPSCVDFNKKVVKLNSSKNHSDSNDIIVKDFTKKVQLNSTTCSKTLEKTPQETKNSSDTSAVEDSSSSPTPKKIKKISWP